MPTFKKSKPLAVCNICGEFADDRSFINSRCKKNTFGRRCTGIFKSGLGQIWEECKSCKGYGRVGSVGCSECKESGWKLLK
jgi:DnaJ-class molecular chaperone